jgi:hypothetical protein
MFNSDIPAANSPDGRRDIRNSYRRRPPIGWRANRSRLELKPVEVHVFALDLLEFAGDSARISVHCSAGTYLRSIAHEVGQAWAAALFSKPCGEPVRAS